MKILVTGAAGFIGFHLVHALKKENFEITGLDSINDYYDISLKRARLHETGIIADQIQYAKEYRSDTINNYRFFKINLTDKENVFKLIENTKFDIIVNLAAQAGVRYSLQNPYAYLDSNISGFLNILEGSQKNNIKHLIYASSSSVYGNNTKTPFSIHDNVDYPVSLYAATKKANELMAHTYSHLYSIPTTGLRFFTVYGPWGRPDMAYFSFVQSILNKKPIKVYNHGKLQRDFTYIDDIIDGIVRIIRAEPPQNTNVKMKETEKKASVPYRLYNIGNNKPVSLMKFINTIENALGINAIKEMYDMQPGDVLTTWADVDDLMKDFNYRPDTSIEDGIQKFVDWYKCFYRI